MRRIAHLAAAALVLVVGGLLVWVVFETAPVATKAADEVVLPVVRTMTVSPQPLQLTVRTHGTVRPRTEIRLVAEVAGRVTMVSPALWSGGFFEQGAVLVELDRRDYELQVTRAAAEVQQAVLALAVEEAEAASARAEWRQMQPGTPASALALREPQLAQARAAVAAAEANQRKAELDLERTVLRAPFAGRTRIKSVDVGQYVLPGVAVAELYAVDFAEVRLPLPDEQLAFLDLPPDALRGVLAAPPAVVLAARFAGRRHEWRGHLVRIEGEIDLATRMIYAVARVDDPYGRRVHRPAPLSIGMFVDAEISGREVPDCVALPRSALREDGRTLVVVPDVEAEVERAGWSSRWLHEVGLASPSSLVVGRLRFRDVEILRRERSRVLLAGGLRAGEIVCLSPLTEVIDGMRVRYVRSATQPAVPDVETERRNSESPR